MKRPVKRHNMGLAERMKLEAEKQVNRLIRVVVNCQVVLCEMNDANKARFTINGLSASRAKVDNLGEQYEIV